MLRYIAVLSILYFVKIASLHSTPFFRRDYRYISSTKSFYKFHTTQRDWADAKKRCELEGASLFYPVDVAEADAVIDFWNTSHPTIQWLFVGISDSATKESFVSVDGKPMKDIYNRWGESKPNKAAVNQYCVQLGLDGTYNDDKCLKKMAFICKKTADTVQWNTLCDMHDPAYLYNAELRKCYKFHRDSWNWTQAYGICAAEDSYLAIINSQKESEYLAKLTEQADKNIYVPGHLDGYVHLGFHNLYENGWITIKGTPLEDTGFTTFGKGQPDNAGGTEKCGGMLYDGYLNDISCFVSCFFICEHDIGLINNDIDERLGLIMGDYMKF